MTDAIRARAEQAREQALALLNDGRFDESLSLYDEALRDAQETGDAAFIDWISVCRAAAAAETGKCDAELISLKQVLLRTTDSQTAFRAGYTLARIYEIRKDRRKALFYSRIAAEHAGRTGEKPLAVAVKNQSANLLTCDCRFEEAAALYRELLDDEDAASRPLWRAIVRENLGYCLIALDRPAEGIPLVQDALEQLESLGARAFTVEALMDLAFGNLKSDRFAEARYFGESALERLDASNDPSTEKNLLYLVGEACQASGDLESARVYFDRLASHYPEFRNLRAYLEVFDFRNVINLRA